MVLVPRPTPNPLPTLVTHILARTYPTIFPFSSSAM